MKTSIKIGALALVLLSSLSLGVKAQTKDEPNGVRFSIGPTANLPVGRFGDRYNWSIGGSIQADIPVASKFFLVGQTGFDSYFAKKGVNSADLQIIPLKAGLKYDAIGGLYVQATAGGSFLLNRNATGYGKTLAFAYAPEVGYRFALNAKSAIDAGVKWEGNSKFTDGGSTNNLFGLRVAYEFGL